MSTKYVYSFGPWGADGDASMKNSLGGKGANLAEMCRLKLPVPAGFTISTEFCTVYLQGGKKFPESLKEEVQKALCKTEEAMGKKYGDADNPLADVLPQRRPQVDARHDGNRLERGPLPRHDPWAGEEVRAASVSCGTPIAA